MKYLSMIVLLALIFWSWTAVNSPAPISLGTHVGLQQNLKSLIQDKIHQMLPNANDIVFEHMQTRTLSETQVEADFTYSYHDRGTDAQSAAKTTLSGRAILNQHIPAVGANESSPDANWTFDKLEMNGESVDFDTAGEGENGAAAPTK